MGHKQMTIKLNIWVAWPRGGHSLRKVLRVDLDGILHRIWHTCIFGQEWIFGLGTVASAPNCAE